MTGRNVLHATGVLRGARELHLAILRARGRRQPRASVSGERDAQSLRILGCTPTALPDHRRGAEVTLHLVMRELRARGHDARILLTQPGTSTTLGGVPVLGPLDRTRAHELA
ncbi:MAG TPA: hypothetical protein VEP49_06530, partial [Acidimicrobiia bacterium]|nr:hypothetical protein [Acidimicrobiia bacterium]